MQGKRVRISVSFPKDKEHVLAALTDEATQTGRSRNELIIEAIELHAHLLARPRYRTFPLSPGQVDRADYYPGCF